jgi:hypothetical protein
LAYRSAHASPSFMPRSRTAALLCAGALALSMVVAGCTTTGRNFNGQRLSQLVPGQTTFTQATVLLEGQPAQTYRNRDGSMLAVWSHKVSTAGDLFVLKEAQLQFGPDGRYVGLVDSTNLLTQETHNQQQPAVQP